MANDPLHLKPYDKKLRPVAFDIASDVNRGLYVDENGERIDAADISKHVKKPGKKIVRVTFRVRYRSDPPNAPTRKKTALAIVDGSITPEQLNRIVYKLARDQYEGSEPAPPQG